MLTRGNVEIHILILRKANQSEYAPFMWELRQKFIFNNCWKEYARNKQGLTAARKFLRTLKPTILIDLVGNMHGRYDTFPERCDAQRIMHWVNTSCLTYDSRYHSGIFDRGMLEREPEDVRGEGRKEISLWQPALPGILLDAVDRSIEPSFSSGRFNILLDVYLDRAGEATDVCLEILKSHPDAYLHIQASPVALIMVILEQARKFEEDNCVLAGTIESRIVPLRRQPTDEYIKNLRAYGIHVAISGGPYPAHTGHQVAMGAGILGLIVPFESMMNRAPRFMNEFAGTGALNPISRPDTIDIIEQLKANRFILKAVRVHYDGLSINRDSIFDPCRAVRDMEDMALDVFQGEGKTSFCSTKPSPPIVQVIRDEFQKLQQIILLPKGGHDDDPTTNQFR